MKLDINFTDYPVRRIRSTGLVLLLMNLGLVSAAAYLMVESERLESDNQELSQKSSKLQLKLTALQESAQHLPKRSDLNQLQDKVKTINAVLQKHSFDSGRVFDAIESSSPKSVFLKNYSHDSKNGLITLKAVSSKSKNLLAFFKKLEKHRAFKKVLLVRQDTIKEQGKLRYRFEIKLEQVI